MKECAKISNLAHSVNRMRGRHSLAKEQPINSPWTFKQQALLEAATDAIERLHTHYNSLGKLSEVTTTNTKAGEVVSIRLAK